MNSLIYCQGLDVQFCTLNVQLCTIRG